jgi:hypothetical protein
LPRFRPITLRPYRSHPHCSWIKHALSPMIDIIVCFYTRHRGSRATKEFEGARLSMEARVHAGLSASSFFLFSLSQTFIQTHGVLIQVAQWFDHEELYSWLLANGCPVAPRTLERDRLHISQRTHVPDPTKRDRAQSGLLQS